jgi:hypothetical protein
MPIRLVIPFAWSALMMGASFAALPSARATQALRATRRLAALERFLGIKFAFLAA